MRKHRLGGLGEVGQKKIEDPPQTAREFDLLIDAVKAELDSKLFLFVPNNLAKYYEADSLLKDETQVRFPDASEEIRRAGNCLACGLSRSLHLL